MKKDLASIGLQELEVLILECSFDQRHELYAKMKDQLAGVEYAIDYWGYYYQKDGSCRDNYNDAIAEKQAIQERIELIRANF